MSAGAEFLSIKQVVDGKDFWLTNYNEETHEVFFSDEEDALVLPSAEAGKIVSDLRRHHPDLELMVSPVK